MRNLLLLIFALYTYSCFAVDTARPKQTQTPAPVVAVETAPVMSNDTKLQVFQAQAQANTDWQSLQQSSEYIRYDVAKKAADAAAKELTAATEAVKATTGFLNSQASTNRFNELIKAAKNGVDEKVWELHPDLTWTKITPKPIATPKEVTPASPMHVTGKDIPGATNGSK